MSASDPLVIFIAGGATGILGTVVAEFAASKRQARQLKQDLDVRTRERTIEIIDEAVGLIYEMIKALIDLRLSLNEVPPGDRDEEALSHSRAQLLACQDRQIVLRAYDVQLSLRFGKSELGDSFSVVVDRCKEQLDELSEALDSNAVVSVDSPFDALSEAMDEFAVVARDATGGLSK